MSGRLMFHDGVSVRNVDKYWWEVAPNGQLVAANSSTAVTADATANTKGAWLELAASTSRDADKMQINVWGISVSATNTATLLDIGFGAAGAEQVVLSNIAVGGAYVSGGISITPIEVAMFVPAGTRISARIQSAVAGGKTASVAVYLWSSNKPTLAPTSVDSYGGNTANSQGIAVTSANTWVQVSASTPRAYRAVCLVPSLHTNNAAAASNYILSVGYGTAGNEVEVGGVNCYRTATEYTYRSIMHPNLIIGYIPAGSRLVIKDSAGGTGAGATLVGIP